MISIANKYTDDGEELNSDRFGGGSETVEFLKSRGFNIRKKQLRKFDEELVAYLKRTFFTNLKIIRNKRSWLRLGQEIIYVNGSIILEENKGFYDLDYDIFRPLTEKSNHFYAIILGSPETTFLLPGRIVNGIFGKTLTPEKMRNRTAWLFKVYRKNGKYVLNIQGDKDEHEIEEFLNKWEQIPGLTQPQARALSFVDLQRFILNEMVMQANYQPIMIRTLLENEGRASKDTIAIKIQELNQDNPGQDFRNIPVYEVLEKHGIVREENDQFVLNIDEITTDEIQQLIVLCKWKIPNLPLDLEELIVAFNKNMNLFDPDGFDSSQRNKDHQMFVTRFPMENITNIQLDEYVAGKPDPQTGLVNKSTYCYLLEFGLPSFGGIGGRHAGKFGIHYNKKLNEYVYDKRKYSSPEEAFNHIKGEISKILEAGNIFHSNRDWKKFSDIVEENDYDLYRNVRSKILTVYFPDDFLNMHIPSLIDTALSALAKEVNKTDKLYLKEEKLFEVKNNHDIMKNWDNGQFSHFVWRGIIKRDNSLEDESQVSAGLQSNAIQEHSHIFITGYDERNLDISKQRGILGWVNKSNFLSAGSLVFVFNKDSLVLETCFEIKSRSSDKDLIWEDEKATQKIIYSNRWDAKVLYDSLDIALQEINSIPPFDKEKFQGLLRGNFPMPLDTPSNNEKYSEFRKMLLGRIRSDSALSETSLWLVRAGNVGQGEEVALEKELVGIGYDGLPGLDSINEFKAFKEHYKKTHPNATPGNVGKVAPQIWSFMYDIRKRDLVILPLKTQNSKLIAVGQIIGDYKYGELNSEIKQFRPVKWFKKDVPRNEFDPDIEKSFDAQGTVRYVGNSGAVNKVISMLERLGIGTSNAPLEDTRSWLSLNGQEIEEIIDSVLEAEGKKLEIRRSVIRRIVSHLILSKHVILVGPPGTGKTDLARRLLSKLGNKLLGKSEPVESVASYEWGRFEVIGGISIAPEHKKDPFHLGCVTHAIKEGKLLLIDEFNRADMNKAFGEMFLALDHGVIQLKDDENPIGFLLKSPNEIEIPAYFRMICTMNDYDKSLLNELSYGLLRRFAFVEINVPTEKKKIIDIVTQRAKLDLKDLDAKLLDNSASKIEIQVDKFVEFLISISEKRQIGISSYIDVIRYTLYGISIANANPWNIMNDALIDYILPQFDRLDFDTLDFAHKSALEVFKNENGTLAELQPFFNTLNNKVKTMQNLNKLFTTEES